MTPALVASFVAKAELFAAARGWFLREGARPGVTRPPPPLTFERLPFDAPLYVMFSSGTTGR